MANKRFDGVAAWRHYTQGMGCYRRGSRWACSAGAVRKPAHCWYGLLLALVELGANARACGRTRGALGLGVRVGDRRIAVGVGLLGGVGRITRTGPDVLGPGAHPNRHVTVGTGLGGLFALAGDLAVLALAGRARLGLGEWNWRVLGVRLTITQRLALAVVDMIDRACGVLRVGVSKECRRGVFVVGFGTALARGACIECRDFAECLELTLGANVQRSGELRLEEVFA